MPSLSRHHPINWHDERYEMLNEDQVQWLRHIVDDMKGPTFTDQLIFLIRNMYRVQEQTSSTPEARLVEEDRDLLEVCLMAADYADVESMLR